MRFSEFRDELVAMGFSYLDILKLNTMAYQFAFDAHEDEYSDWTDYDLNYIGRQFVMDNIEEIREEI